MNTKELQGSANELLDVFFVIGKALEDDKITWSEIPRLTKEVFEFIVTLKKRKQILSEWKALDNRQKTEIVYNYIVLSKEIGQNENLTIYYELLETIMKIIFNFSETVDLVIKIREIRAT